MDFRDIVEKCVVVGIDVCFLSYFYKQYKYRIQVLEGLKSAQHLDLDHELPQKIRDSGGEIPYAVISAKARPLGEYLTSEHVPSIAGILSSKVVKEHKAIWIPFLRMWGTSDEITKRYTRHVPFGLFSRMGMFKKPMCVEIVDPLVAQGLRLAEVYRDYKYHKASLADTLVGLFLKEHTIGVEEVEFMLLDNTALTAIGKLVIKDDVMKMMPPEFNLPYYVTPESYRDIVNTCQNQARVYKSLTIIMCIVTTMILSFIAKKGYREIKRRICIARDLKRRQEARMAMREAVPQNAPKCVVCIENPVEIVVLECGHACLCLNCADQRFESCPVCRGEVDRLVPVYMP